MKKMALLAFLFVIGAVAVVVYTALQPRAPLDQPEPPSPATATAPATQPPRASAPERGNGGATAASPATERSGAAAPSQGTEPTPVPEPSGGEPATEAEKRRKLAELVARRITAVEDEMQQDAKAGRTENQATNRTVLARLRRQLAELNSTGADAGSP